MVVAYRWESWAAPKAADGTFDHNNALTGDDLREFVDAKLANNTVEHIAFGILSVHMCRVNVARHHSKQSDIILRQRSGQGTLTANGKFGVSYIFKKCIVHGINLP